MTLDELCARRVAVWGIGSEGLAMVRLLIQRGVDPMYIDDSPGIAQARLDQQAGTGGRVQAPGDVTWSDVDVVVRAPGVSRYRPELDRARSHGVGVTTAMALWLEDFADARVVAVTGTKGKSTTAALTAAILGEEGMDVALIGNIGVPVVECYGRPLVDAYVVEVSSYQAADVEVSPGVVVLTSLAPDHLDWHGGEETYYRDKLRLIDAGPAGALAVNAGSAEAVRRTEDHPARTLFGPGGRVRVDDAGRVSVDGTPVLDGSRLRPPGLHNLWNLCGAITGATLLNGAPPSAATVEAVVEGFDGLPSRCRTVGERHGLTFVDDALASNPFATVASLDAFPGREVTVILGGADRGVDPRDLVDALSLRRPTPRVVVLPPDHGRLVDALATTGAGRPSPVVAMADDVAGAVRAAVAVTPSGGVVLFSPAAPTPEGEGGFGARSRQFVAAAGLDPAEPGIDSRRRDGNGVAPDAGAVRKGQGGGE
jgi:UDP-N-acetylmuramoyl-L-alanine---L-glutamate ligase